ncbi:MULTISPECIES: hypothetical protein [unclassified Acidovorax]|uniref:hypothetical protein n=1 Tax=unclassified Acidovorax TaxID=2684926 RepID=UPI001C457DC3|nr:MULTISPECIES: hypothetical protein [unclassified Acidovorax]MBV7428796.1 hypothetical protein [Acidovorax sp. sif0732]MBV7450622.1 hypothetical protein [Acidovorax sp. sif0715]
MRTPPELLLLKCRAAREGGRHQRMPARRRQRGGAALARRLLAWAAPVADALDGCSPLGSY